MCTIELIEGIENKSLCNMLKMKSIRTLIDELHNLMIEIELSSQKHQELKLVEVCDKNFKTKYTTYINYKDIYTNNILALDLLRYNQQWWMIDKYWRLNENEEFLQYYIYPVCKKAVAYRSHPLVKYLCKENYNECVNYLQKKIIWANMIKAKYRNCFDYFKQYLINNANNIYEKIDNNYQIICCYNNTNLLDIEFASYLYNYFRINFIYETKYKNYRKFDKQKLQQYLDKITYYN